MAFYSGVISSLLLSAAFTVALSTMDLGPYWEYGCNGDVVTMTCPQDDDPPEAQYMFIDNSTYGTYTTTCSDPCCEPQNSDCHMHVDSAYPGDLEKIKTECDKKIGSCSWTVDIDSNHLVKCSRTAQFQIFFFTCTLADGSLPTTTTTTTTTVPPTTTTEPSTTTTQRPSTTVPPGDSSSNIGAIIGGVLGGICAIAIIVLIVLICRRRQEALKAQKQQQAKLRVLNGKSTSPNGTVTAYDNTAYSEEHVDDEMVLGKQPRISQLSKSNSMHSENSEAKYENVSEKTQPTTENKRASMSPSVRSITNSEGNTSQSSATIYENMDISLDPAAIKTSTPIRPPSRDGEKTNKQNGSAADLSPKANDSVKSSPYDSKFVKKSGASKSKTTAPVEKKAAPLPPANLSKAVSAMDISSTAKLDKSSPHKKSAPCLGTSMSLEPVDIEALKANDGIRVVKKQEALDNIAESESSSKKNISKSDEESKVQHKGPGKELF